MNIFVTDPSPVQSAADLCDKHIVKMILESAQMLCSAHWIAWQNKLKPYKNLKGRDLKNWLHANIPTDLRPAYSMTHVNHPCSVWVRQTVSNYLWLVHHALALCENYTKRYHRTHKTEAIIIWLAEHLPPVFESNEIGLTQFAVAMPDNYKVPNDPVQSYRNYYIGSKARMAKWRHCSPPSWWPNTYSVGGSIDEDEEGDAI